MAGDAGETTSLAALVMYLERTHPDVEVLWLESPRLVPRSMCTVRLNGSGDSGITVFDDNGSALLMKPSGWQLMLEDWDIPTVAEAIVHQLHADGQQ